MKPLILYHSGCMDGSGAALAAWMKFRDNAVYMPINYGEVIIEFGQKLNDEPILDREIYLLDFCFKANTLSRLVKMAKTVIVIDHHKTAKEELDKVLGSSWDTAPQNLQIVFDLERSGAVLSWMTFHPGTEVPSMLKYIEDRDLWRWKLPNSKEINTALEVTGLKTDFQQPELILAWDTRAELNLIEQGTAVLKYQDQLIKQITRNANPENPFVWAINSNHTTKICPANTCVLQSEVCNYILATRWGPFTIKYDIAVAYYFDEADEKYRVSLRSTKDGPDVSEIAKQFGGGGHKNAAGFECEELPWL